MLIRTILTSALLVTHIGFASEERSQGDDLLQQLNVELKDSTSEEEAQFLSRTQLQWLYIERDEKTIDNFVDDIDANFSSELVAEKGNTFVLRDVGQ